MHLSITDSVKQVFHGGSSRLLSLIDITPDDVFKQISRIKDGKAPGDDTINPAFLKHIASEISEPLSIIYNKSVTEEVVPEEWKRANITPLFTKGSRSEPGNYRPVSLTSYLSKILESIIKEKMFCHLMDKILSY